MNITIHRDGENYGPYTLDQVKEYLENGTLNGTDLVWQDSSTEWLPLKDVVTVLTPPPPSPKLPPIPVANTLTFNQKAIGSSAKKQVSIGKIIGFGVGSVFILIFSLLMLTILFLRSASDQNQKLIYQIDGDTLITKLTFEVKNPLDTDDERRRLTSDELRRTKALELALIPVVKENNSIKKVRLIISLHGQDSQGRWKQSDSPIDFDENDVNEWRNYSAFDIATLQSEQPTESSDTTAKITGIYKSDTGNLVYETITLYDNGTFTYDDPDFIFKHDEGTYTIDSNNNIFFTSTSKIHGVQEPPPTSLVGHGQIDGDSITMPSEQFNKVHQ